MNSAAKTILNTIGNTPLVRLSKSVSGKSASGVDFWAKLEWFNPGGSVKDRTAHQIVSDALHSGQLKPGMKLIDSTSGNTGISYALIGAVLGISVTLVVPENVSPERIKVMKFYGAELIYSDPMEGSDGARKLAKEAVRRSPGTYFFADQYSNSSNWRAHYLTTGPEIWRQSEGRITHFIAALGTSGTLVGAGRYLKEQKPGVKVIGIQPEAFHGIEGWKHMESAERVPIYDPHVHDQKMTIQTEAAYETAESLGPSEGLLASPSAGGALAGALEAMKDTQEAVVVVIFADGGDKYLSRLTMPLS